MRPLLPCILLSLGLLGSLAAAPEPHYAGTLAGSPSGLQTAVDGPRLAAVFRAPRQAVVDAQGLVYVADTGNQLIRRIGADGSVTTLAGQLGVSGFADGLGSSARFNEPSGLLPAPQGGVWVLDSNNGRIRHVAADGRVSTLAGGGAGPGGSRHADGQGGAAAFNEPRGFAQDAAGNLYVADYQNQVIRKITPAGLVTTLAGSPGQQGSVDGAGSAARFSDPQAVAIDSAGNLYVADTGPSKAIRKITPAGVVSTLLSGQAVRLSEPRGLALLADGSLLIADAQEQHLLQLSPAGVATVLVGQTGRPGLSDGSGTAASLYTPMGLGAGPDGSLLVADSGNHLIRQLQGAQLSLWAGLPGHSASVEGERKLVRFEDPFAVAVDAAGNAYLADGTDHAIRRINPLGFSRVWAGQPGSYGFADGTATAARFRKPAGLAVAADGTLYIADSGNQAVRRITPDGQVSTLAGNGERGSRDGQGSAAQFNEPMGLALASDGSLYVADFGNHLLRRVTPAGLVSTVAGSAGQGGFVDGAATATARLRSPVDVAVGSDGRVFVLDRSNHAIRVLEAAGQLGTLAGSGSAGYAEGSGRSARFQFPSGLAPAADGGLWVADTDNQRLRHVTAAGEVSSPLGLQAGRADGVGSAARFFNPKDVAVGADGRLLIVDRGNRSLRWAQALASGTTAIECLLDWGERTYPTLLQPPALSQDLAPYRYRAYAGALYVGVSSTDQQVYLLQQGRLEALGALSGFLAQAACR